MTKHSYIYILAPTQSVLVLSAVLCADKYLNISKITYAVSEGRLRVESFVAKHSPNSYRLSLLLEYYNNRYDDIFLINHQTRYQQSLF